MNGTAEDFAAKLHNLPKRTSSQKRQVRLERGLEAGTHRKCPACQGIKPKLKFGPKAKRCKACCRPWRLYVPIRTSTFTVVKNKKDYERYLKSEHWQEVRNQYWASPRPKACYVCAGKSTDLHHRTYERLGRELLTDMVAVCRDCHFSIHEYHNTHRDQSLWQATRNYRTLVKDER